MVIKRLYAIVYALSSFLVEARKWTTHYFKEGMEYIFCPRKERRKVRGRGRKGRKEGDEGKEERKTSLSLSSVLLLSIC